MSRPTRQQQHLDALLTNMSLAIFNDPAQYIANQVFPSVPSQKQSNKYIIYSQADFMRAQAKKRAAGDQSVGADYSVSRDSFFCEKLSVHMDITEEDRINTDDPMDADRDALEFVVNQCDLTRELEFLDTFVTDGVWGTDVDGVAAAPGAGEFLQWNDADSVPVQDFLNGMLQIGSQTGKTPNIAILGPRVWAALWNNPDILDRISGGATATVPGIVTDPLLARILNVEKVLIPWSIQNSAVEGATADYDFIFEKDALLLYTPARVGLKTACSGKTFVWTGLPGTNEIGARINRMDVPLVEGSERIECDHAYDMKVTSAPLGYFFKDAVA